MTNPNPNNFNLPGDLIHSIEVGFCRLVIPWTRGRWFAFRRGLKDSESGRTVVTRGLALVDTRDIHNCSATGQF